MRGRSKASGMVQKHNQNTYNKKKYEELYSVMTVKRSEVCGKRWQERYRSVGMKWLQQNCVTRNVRAQAATEGMKSATNMQVRSACRVYKVGWFSLFRPQNLWFHKCICNRESVFHCSNIDCTLVHYSNSTKQLQKKFALESTGRHLWVECNFKKTMNNSLYAKINE